MAHDCYLYFLLLKANYWIQVQISTRTDSCTIYSTDGMIALRTGRSANRIKNVMLCSFAVQEREINPPRTTNWSARLILLFYYLYISRKDDYVFHLPILGTCSGLQSLLLYPERPLYKSMRCILYIRIFRKLISSQPARGPRIFVCQSPAPPGVSVFILLSEYAYITDKIKLDGVLPILEYSH